MIPALQQPGSVPMQATALPAGPMPITGEGLPLLSPRSVIEMLLRRKFVFLAVFCTVVGIAAIYVTVATRRYESFASILVKIGTQDIATPDVAGAQQDTPPGGDLAKEVINSQVLQAQTVDVVRDAIQKVGLARLYPTIAATAPDAATAMAGAIDRVINHDMDVKVAKESTVIKMSLLNPDPAMAQEGLSALLASFMKQQATATHDPRLAFLHEQLGTLGKKVDEAQSAMLDYKRSSGIDSLDQERQLVLAQRDTIEQNINTSKALLATAKARQVTLAAELAKTPASIALGDENDAAMRVQGDSSARLSAATARYQTAQQSYTPGNPLLKDAQAALALAQADYARATATSGARVRTGVNAVYQTLQTQLEQARSDAAAAQSAVDQWQTRLAAINDRAAHFNAIEADLFKLQRQLDVATQDYTAYLSRAEAAKISEDLNNARITSLAVIETPSLPLKPAQPRGLLILAAATVAGLIAAIVACFALNLLDDRIFVTAPVDTLLGLPVLASLPYAKQPTLTLP